MTGVDDAVEIAEGVTVLAGVIVTVLPVVIATDVSVVAAGVEPVVWVVAVVGDSVVNSVDVGVGTVADEAVEPGVDDCVLPVVGVSVVNGVAVLEIPVGEKKCCYFSVDLTDAEISANQP